MAGSTNRWRPRTAATTALTTGIMKANLFIAINRIIFSSFSSAVFGIGTSFFFWAPPTGSGSSGVEAVIRLTQRNNHGNISELLDNLLRGYDNSIRPDFGGKSFFFVLAIHRFLEHFLPFILIAEEI